MSRGFIQITPSLKRMVWRTVLLTNSIVHLAVDKTGLEVATQAINSHHHLQRYIFTRLMKRFEDKMRDQPIGQQHRDQIILVIELCYHTSIIAHHTQVIWAILSNAFVATVGIGLEETTWTFRPHEYMTEMTWHLRIGILFVWPLSCSLYAKLTYFVPPFSMSFSTLAFRKKISNCGTRIGVNRPTRG